jgi:hypothetical protein
MVAYGRAYLSTEPGRQINDAAVLEIQTVHLSTRSCIKARTREDSVTMESCGGIGADAAAGEPAGGGGGAGDGLCANATELNTSPSAVSFRDGICIGNTSTAHKASGMPFLEIAKVS